MGTVEIPLKNSNKVALIDEEDYPLISQFRWKAVENHRATYAGYWTKKNNVWTAIFMHRVVMNAEKGEPIDHISCDGLDNRKANLRFCTIALNAINRRLSTTNTSGYRGVHPYRDGRWAVNIKRDGKKYHVGYYENLLEAARAYDVAARFLHGEFGRYNFPRRDERPAR